MRDEGRMSDFQIQDKLFRSYKLLKSLLLTLSSLAQIIVSEVTEIIDG
jgi:hypothetical protein